MKFRHIETAEVFNNTKFSADKHNRTYFIGNNDEITETGTPTVTFDEIVFCKELRILYTHGALYRNLIGKDTFLEQKSDLDLFTPYAEDGKIVEYIGPTDEKYVNGFIYQCVRADSTSPMNGFRIQTSSDESIIPVDDIFYYQNDITDIAYVSDDRDYYSYTVPEVGSTVYRRGIRIITPYIVKSSVKVNSYWNGYDVTIYLPENPSYEKIISLRNLYPGELWVNTHGLVVTAAPYRVFTGVVKVGNRHVSITTEPVMNSTVFWKQIIPLPKVIDPKFEQVIVNNTNYINSSDTNTIRFSESGNIKLTKAGDEIIIGNESEIDDSDISLTKTWSSDKLNRIIETLTEAGANNFRIVDELPTEDIDPTSIYFVPAENAEEEDGSSIKEEYVYINGQWELLGTTQLDLSGYYTAEETNEIFPTKDELYNNYYTNEESDDRFVNKVALDNYYKKSETDELLSEKQDNITAIEPLALDENSNLSIDLSAYDTIEDVDRKLAGKQDVIGGQNGEVIYHNGSDVFAQTLMSPGMVVTTEHDLVICKATAPSFKTVFESWKMFSHSATADNANATDMRGWSYIESADTIQQKENSASYTGFISPVSYSNYELMVRVYSSDTDDDMIGLVAAFAKDSDGKEHTLSFLRTTRGDGIYWQSTGWACVLDFRTQRKSALTGTTAILQQINNSDTNPNKAWNNFYVNENNGGTVIYVKREGNVFTAKCSKFGTTELLDSTEMVIDLNALSTQYPTLNLFKGASPWGYSTYSQKMSRYQNISITDASRLIFDTVHDSVWSFETVSSGGKAWVELPNKKPITEMGIGRLNFNPVTKKLFYNNGIEIQELSTQYKEGGFISISEDNVISSTYSASDKKISLTRNGTELGSFTLNQATDKSIEIPGAVYIGGDAVNITSDNVVNVKIDDDTIKLDENGNLKAAVHVDEPGNGEVRIIHDSTDLCTFTLNQTANKELDLSNTYYNKAEVDSKIQTSQSMFTNSIALISQDAYDALSVKDPNTLYLIAEVGG